MTIETTLGEWIASLYEAALADLGDPDLAAVVTATLVDEHLIERALPTWKLLAAA